MKKILLFVFILIFSLQVMAGISAKSYGISGDYTHRLRIELTGETSNVYTYNWTVYDVSTNAVSCNGSNSMYVDNTVLNIEKYIAGHGSFSCGDMPILTIITEDEADE